MVNPVEMATTHQHVVEQLSGIPGYVAMFQKAFPEPTPSRSTSRMSRTRSPLFEATLITPNAPSTVPEGRRERAHGASRKKDCGCSSTSGCAGCHNGINVGGGMYAAFGVVERPGADILPPDDKGRFQVTKIGRATSTSSRFRRCGTSS